MKAGALHCTNFKFFSQHTFDTTNFGFDLVHANANTNSLVGIVTSLNPDWHLCDAYVFEGETNKSVDKFMVKIVLDKRQFVNEVHLHQSIFEKSVRAGHHPPICPHLLHHKWQHGGSFLSSMLATVPSTKQSWIPPPLLQAEAYGIVFMEYVGESVNLLITRKLNTDPTISTLLTELCAAPVLKPLTEKYSVQDARFVDLKTGRYLVDFRHFSLPMNDFNKTHPLRKLLPKVNDYWKTNVVANYLKPCRRLMIRLGQLGYVHGDHHLSNFSMTKDGLFYLFDFGLTQAFDHTTQAAFDQVANWNENGVTSAQMSILAGKKFAPNRLNIQLYDVDPTNKYTISDSEDAYLTKVCAREIYYHCPNGVLCKPMYAPFSSVYPRDENDTKEEQIATIAEYLKDAKLKYDSSTKKKESYLSYNKFVDRKWVEPMEKTTTACLTYFWLYCSMYGWLDTNKSPLEMRYEGTNWNTNSVVSEADYVASVASKIRTPLYEYEKSQVRVCKKPFINHALLTRGGKKKHVGRRATRKRKHNLNFR
jgi:hypothetical protein